ncbi:TonB-dependent receptor [Novosphingobium sp. 9U]|uniref:TonB-dependent receptor n=1 Tax=Novosphingobium sp. 9U TaxID=2653158 RepID=UPI0012EFB347|nr:TonB-dependent receptor [Novosphingobium sp. 9U]VWX48240.1 conserved exported hypothetical protein [Novosphingobium sp. 9U]
MLGKSKLPFWLLASTAGLYQPACAQSVATSPPSGLASDQTADIIVTARKRQESILKVPVIEAVLTGDTLDRQQVTSLDDISSLVPGVVLGVAPLEVGTQISVRGIGTSSLDPGIDQSVSLNLDGLQLSQGLAYSVGLFDMAQVEVLKGPQALFFGKNSPGGVISIRTADPGQQLETTARLSYGAPSNTWRGEAIVSGPVTDTLGLRLAVMYQDDGGYFRNRAVPAPGTGAVDPADRFGQTRTLYLRGTALFEPSSDLKVRLKANYTRDKGKGGAPFQLKSCPEGTFAYAGVPFYGVGEDCKPDRTLYAVDLDPDTFIGVVNGGHPFTNIRQFFGTLEVDYPLQPSLDLTWISGYYDLKSDAMIGGTYAGQAASVIVAQKHFTRREFTQELRLNSDYAGPLNFTAGAFYQRATVKNDIDLLGNTSFLFPAVLGMGNHDVGIKSLSAFGQLRLRVAPRFEISGGVRFTNEKRHDNAETIDVFGVYDGAPGSTVFPALPRLNTSNWSPELTLTWTATDDLTLFGSVKQGYKSGSYNLIVPANPGDDNSFGDEKVQGGEVGLKYRFADRQVFVNLAFYYYKYAGLQVGANEAAQGGLPRIRTVNAGSAKSYGIDSDATYKPQGIAGLSFTGAVSWNIAKFTKFLGAPCAGGQTIAQGCNSDPVPVTDPADIAAGYYSIDPATGGPVRFQGQDLSGAALPRAPRWQVSLGADYEAPVTSGLVFGIGANANYSSRYLTVLGRRADFYQAKFAKINANLRIKDVRDAWEVGVMGNNLTNRFVTGNCTITNYAGGQAFPGSISGAPNAGAAGTDEVLCPFDRGREVWLRLTLRPGKF